MKNIFKKISKMTLVLTVLFSYFISPNIVYAYQNGDLNNTNKDITLITSNHSSLQAGDAKLTKSISVVDASQGIYRVNISTQGKNITTTHSEAAKLYIAIAFDTSDSMGSTNGSKFSNARNGVRQFVTNIQSQYPNAEFALITYSGRRINRWDTRFKTGFGSNDLMQQINNLESEGTCTKLGAGINHAARLLNEKKNENVASNTNLDSKYIMLVFGDGEPTCDDATWLGGSGKNYKDESDDAKDAGIEIFSIGYDVASNSSGDRVLRYIASDSKDTHYKRAEVEGIVTTLSGLTSNISVTSPALINGSIADVIGDDFVYAGNKSGNDVTVNGQNVSINVGTVTESTKSYWFDIKVNPDASGFKNNSWHDTNRGISLTGTGTGGTLATTNSASVYWQKQNEYRIEYYYDNVIDDTKTVRENADAGTTITVTDSMINTNKGDYEYISTNPASKTITVSDNGDNVIKVYYESYKKLSIKKELENTNNNDKTFNIKVTFKNSDNSNLSGTYKYKINSGSVNTVTLDGGVANIGIKGNDTVEFLNIPKNTKYIVEETTIDGYVVKVCIFSTCSNTNTTNGVLDKDILVRVVNTANYELPETGSSGMLILLIIGSLFIGAPVIYISHNFYRKKYE